MASLLKSIAGGDAHGHAGQLEGCCKKINPTIPIEKAGAKGGRPRWHVGYVVLLFVFTPGRRSRTRGKRPAIAIDTSMMTFHEWLARRQAMQSEGMLPKRSASNKRPKPLSAAVPTFKPYKPAQPPRIIPYKPAQPAKITMQKPKT